MFVSRYLPCDHCGASVERVEADGHRCDPERLLDFRMFALREEVSTFQSRFEAFLDTAEGRFHRWLAARDVRAAG